MTPLRSQSAVLCTRFVRSLWSMPPRASRNLEDVSGCVGASSRAVFRKFFSSCDKIVRELLPVLGQLIALLQPGGILLLTVRP